MPQDIPEDTPQDDAKSPPSILYCHCAYAKVVPEEVKQGVLERLSASEAAFDAVPDLCELAARKDPSLKRYVDTDGMKIVACYPRAVRWLFHAAGTPLPTEGVDVLNMRVEEPDDILASLFNPEKGSSSEKDANSERNSA